MTFSIFVSLVHTFLTNNKNVTYEKNTGKKSLVFLYRHPYLAKLLPSNKKVQENIEL